MSGEPERAPPIVYKVIYKDGPKPYVLAPADYTDREYAEEVARDMGGLLVVGKARAEAALAALNWQVSAELRLVAFDEIVEARATTADLFLFGEKVTTILRSLGKGL